MATQGKATQGKAGAQPWRRRTGVTVTDVSEFQSMRLSLRALQARPNQSFIGIIDRVELWQHFNKWRRQPEERLEVLFTDGHSVVLNDGMEQTILEAYGTDAGSWTGRPLTVLVQQTEHENRKTGGVTRTATRALECHPMGTDPLADQDKGQNNEIEIREAAFSDKPEDRHPG